MIIPDAADKLPNLAKHVCKLAKQAGAEALRFYGGAIVVTKKADASPLTLADSASHKFLVESLRTLTPKINIISEESVEAERQPFRHANTSRALRLLAIR